MRTQFITAAEVEKALGVSRSKAYQIIRTLNKELKAMGYITIAGKCPIYPKNIDAQEDHNQGRDCR